MNIQLKKAVSPLEWMKVYRLYIDAFPASERKPFWVILQKVRIRKTDVWCLYADSKFAGFATTINGDHEVLLDYLAVKKAFRGKGIGRNALRAMMDRYQPHGMMVEIESPFEACEDQTERIRRKAFYRSCGMESFGVMANVFGVKMELMGRGCRMNFAQYQDFYRVHYSPWAAEHLSELPYPEIAEE